MVGRQVTQFGLVLDWCLSVFGSTFVTLKLHNLPPSYCSSAKKQTKKKPSAGIRQKQKHTWMQVCVLCSLLCGDDRTTLICIVLPHLLRHTYVFGFFFLNNKLQNLDLQRLSSTAADWSSRRLTSQPPSVCLRHSHANSNWLCYFTDLNESGDFFKTQSCFFSDISLSVIGHIRGTFEVVVCLNNFGIFNRKTARHIGPAGVRNEFWFRFLFFFLKNLNQAFLGLLCLVSINEWSGLDNWALLTYSWS